MEVAAYQQKLNRTGKAIASLVRGIDDRQAVWKSSPAKWSVLEIMMHLWDEEKEDFKVRLDHLLHRPGTEFPPIDPQGWVTERKYNQQKLAEAVEGFLAERDKSVKWLGTLQNPSWDSSYKGPRGWEVSAGDMLSSWTVHDLLHLRQLTHALFLYENQAALPYQTVYAGEWPVRP